MALSANLTYALNILRSLWRRPRKSQTQDNRLLQLPDKLIAYIASFLSLRDLILLAQICYSLHIALWAPMVREAYSRPEYRVYLMRFGGRRPDQWLCRECMMRAHPMFKLDISDAMLSQSSSCPHQEDRGGITYDPRSWMTFHDYLFKQNPPRAGLHHLRLLKKYIKLHLDKFLKYSEALIAMNPNLDLQYRAREGIAGTQDGGVQFLYESIFQYHHRKCDKVSLTDVGDLRICPHITLCSRHLHCSDHPGYRLQQAICRSLDGGPGDGKPHAGACPHCGTEFEVRLGTYWLTITVSQSYGSDGSPEHLALETRCEPVSRDKAPRFIREWFAMGKKRRI
ncbi:hypothetical protein F5Y08DRAFT_349433 [Xylaria arbuscula]|nr:hypothetical protein F5Y08DRAFT_349433 [Xylaria arbuscula]